MKAALVTALAACASERQRAKARRFLQGLSCDELQYIADYFGACILEEDPATLRRYCGASVSPGAHLNDREHKIVLLMEYLGRCVAPQYAAARAMRPS
ncbi:MAG: hypothetical protein ACE15B_11285 [Bryobacteraceae bacterium]